MAHNAAVYSRPDKGNHAETVLYEIDLLRFTKDRLLASPLGRTEADEWVFLEDFLLHFRNLIEFFGNPRPRGTDLTIRRPADFWDGRQLPGPDALDSMNVPHIWTKYDTSKNPQAISKYLHHCTTQRTIKKKWLIADMYEELRPVVERFESLLPDYKPATRSLGHAAVVPLLDGSSTTSGTTGRFPKK